MNVEYEHGKNGFANHNGIHCPATPEKTHGCVAL
jgi:hypothetical protein